MDRTAPDRRAHAGAEPDQALGGYGPVPCPARTLLNRQLAGARRRVSTCSFVETHLSVRRVAGGLGTGPASAAGPVVKSQPGYFRTMLGDLEVTVLSRWHRGSHRGAELLTRTTPVRVGRALKRQYLQDPVETSISAHLDNTGSKLVPTDAGCRTPFGPTLGRLTANLRAAGYRPEQTDEIYTHAHARRSRGRARRRRQAGVSERRRARRSARRGLLAEREESRDGSRRCEVVLRWSNDIDASPRRRGAVQAVRWRHAAGAERARGRRARPHAGAQDQAAAVDMFASMSDCARRIHSTLPRAVRSHRLNPALAVRD